MSPSLPALRNRLRMRHLQLLEALDEHGSLRAAASATHVTQPAATKALQQMEELLGAPLFIRHPRGLMPTTLGEALTRYAKTVLADMAALQAELVAVDACFIGRVRIGSIMAGTPQLLTRALVSLNASHPRLQISVRVDTSDILIQSLRQGHLDLVIGRMPDGWPDDNLTVEQLSEEPLSILVRPDHPAVHAGDTFEALAAHSWVLQPGPSPMRTAIDETFRHWGAQPRAIIETSSILTSISLVRASDMVTVLPEVIARDFQGMGAVTILPFQLNGSLPPYSLIRRTNRECTPAMNRVIEILQTTAAQAQSAD